MYAKIAKFLTPIKMIALLVLLLGLVDNITSPLQHAIGGGLVYSQTPLEIVIRILFVFCGIYGLIGNGKTRRARATAVSLPLLYMFCFYFILWIQYSNDAFIALMTISGVPGLWTLLFGDRYDYK